MRMRWSIVVAVVLLAAVPARAQETKKAEPGKEVFSFYGLRFGMTAEEVRRVFPTDASAGEALKPGHGMSHLQFTYDYRGRLSEIRAAWERPAEAQREEALRRALLERFVQPYAARWRDVSAAIDEYSNRAAMTLVLISLDLREEGLNHFKSEYLRLFE